MEYKPRLSLIVDDETLGFKFFESLDFVARTRSQREAAKILGISHSVLNRRITDSEKKIGAKLVITTGAGSELTETGLEILNKYHYLMKRLKKREKIVICGGYISSGLIDILSTEYGLDALIYQTEDENALYLSDRGMVDILTLDDPVKAFMRDLDFVPIARDHMVLVSSSNEIIEKISQLDGKNFVEISGSAQRLAWNTLDNNGINYKIVKLLKSPFEALKMVKNSENLYTFLNYSFISTFFSSDFISGSDLLKEDTNHLITIVLLNKEDEKLNRFIDFISGRGRKIIKNSGFERV